MQDQPISSGAYPGNRQHRALLQAIVAYYAADPRILSVGVFGSLARGTWDEYSDLDLDVVVADDAVMLAVDEITLLCDSFASIGERPALIIPDGDDAGDVVLESLMELSIRYHPLGTTSPNIVDSLQTLVGRIDPINITAAGSSNRRSTKQAASTLLDRCVRYAVETDAALQRKRIWSAIELLHRMRALIMELYAVTHNGLRALDSFQAQADADVQSRLGGTLPSYHLASAQESLMRFLKFMEDDLDGLTGGRVRLEEKHRRLLNGVRRRQASLQIGVYGQG